MQGHPEYSTAWSQTCLFVGLVVFTCNPSTKKVEAEYLELQASLIIERETMSQP